MRWMKKGFWKLFNNQMWYYKGYRTDYDAAYREVYNMKWSVCADKLEGQVIRNAEKNRYDIFVRPLKE